MGCAAERLTLFAFDEQYVRQLQERVTPVEEHFSIYFQKLLTNYLRRRIKSPELIEDIRQETLLRVLGALRGGTGLKRPECLGSFVLAVCQNVLREFVRAQFRYSPMGELEAPPDAAPDPEALAMGRQIQTSVSSALAQLAERDRQVLAIPLEEDRPHDVCRRLGLKHDHLRVVLHRAKARLRAEIVKMGTDGISRKCCQLPS
jgi:RNA polymerase sigma-70 factor (ECF subfamily)